MSKQNSPEGKGKNAKANKAPALSENETPTGEETPAGGATTAPENEAGEGETVALKDGPDKDELEAAERVRIADLQKVVLDISNVPETLKGLDSFVMLIAIQELEALDIDDSYQEFQGQAAEAMDKAIAQAKELYEKTKAAEAEPVEETRDGFRPDCYEKIDKGITKDTKMIVVKQRYRLGDHTNMTAGDEFVAGQMDARIILSAMNSFHIVPVENKPLEGEHRQVFVNRMMKIYLPDVAPSTCAKKNA